MTKKDFEVVAEILGGIIYTNEYLGKDVWACKDMVDTYLRGSNPNYNPDRFWQAVNTEIQALKGITS